MLLLSRRTIAFVAVVAASCARQTTVTSAPPPVAPPSTSALNEAEVRRLLGALAHDSMEGRATGRPGSERAARRIAAELERSGVRPAGDSGYFHRVPVAFVERNGRRGLALLASLAARDTIAPASRANAMNVLGIIEGSDPAVRNEVVLIGAHYDHVGIRRNESPDS